MQKLAPCQLWFSLMEACSPKALVHNWLLCLLYTLHLHYSCTAESAHIAQNCEIWPQSPASCPKMARSIFTSDLKDSGPPARLFAPVSLATWSEEQKEDRNMVVLSDTPEYRSPWSTRTVRYPSFQGLNGQSVPDVHVWIQCVVQFLKN